MTKSLGGWPLQLRSGSRHITAFKSIHRRVSGRHHVIGLPDVFDQGSSAQGSPHGSSKSKNGCAMAPAPSYM